MGWRATVNPSPPPSECRYSWNSSIYVTESLCIYPQRRCRCNVICCRYHKTRHTCSTGQACTSEKRCRCNKTRHTCSGRRGCKADLRCSCHNIWHTCGTHRHICNGARGYKAVFRSSCHNIRHTCRTPVTADESSRAEMARALLCSSRGRTEGKRTCGTLPPQHLPHTCSTGQACTSEKRCRCNKTRHTCSGRRRCKADLRCRCHNIWHTCGILPPQHLPHTCRTGQDCTGEKRCRCNTNPAHLQRQKVLQGRFALQLSHHLAHLQHPRHICRTPAPTSHLQRPTPSAPTSHLQPTPTQRQHLGTPANSSHQHPRHPPAPPPSQLQQAMDIAARVFSIEAILHKGNSSKHINLLTTKKTSQ